MRQAGFSEISAMNFPAARFPRKSDLRYFWGFAFQKFRKAEFISGEPEKTVFRLIQYSLAGAIDQTKTGRSIECKNRDVDFFHHLAKQSSSFQSAQALLPQCLAQGVHFAQNLAKRVFPIGATRSNRKITLAQSGQEI